MGKQALLATEFGAGARLPLSAAAELCVAHAVSTPQAAIVM